MSQWLCDQHVISLVCREVEINQRMSRSSNIDWKCVGKSMEISQVSRECPGYVSRVYAVSSPQPTSTGKPTVSVALDGFANILVRDTEVVAVCHYDAVSGTKPAHSPIRDNVRDNDQDNTGDGDLHL